MKKDGALLILQGWYKQFYFKIKIFVYENMLRGNRLF